MSARVSVPRSELSTSRVVVGGAFGNLIEWYDWTIFGLLASVFAPSLMPGSDPTVKLIGVLLTFAVGFLLRPVGSLVLRGRSLDADA